MNKKIPYNAIHCKGRVSRGSTLLAISVFTKYNHFIDDNGITGPDWGHSEVVFNCFPIRCFQQIHLSLERSTAYSSRLRVFFWF